MEYYKRVEVWMCLCILLHLQIVSSQDACSDCGECLTGLCTNGTCDRCKEGSMGVCCKEPCPPGCISCDQFARPPFCVLCKDGYYNGKFEDIETQVPRSECMECKTGCVCQNFQNCLRCREGYFNDTRAGKCHECPENCYNCSSHTECNYCNIGYFWNKNHNDCTQCEQYCEICTSSKNCTKCFSRYYERDNDCFQCHPRCKDCNETVCFNCENGLYVRGNNCCPGNCMTCNANTYCDQCIDGFYSNNGLCQRCPDHCLSCTFGSNCSKCAPGYFGEVCANLCPKACKDKSCNKETGKCQGCIDGYYTDGLECTPCPDNCVSCELNVWCNECKTGYKGKTCQDECLNCQPGSPCNKTTGVCYDGCNTGLSGENCDVPCNTNCLSCNRSEPSQCATYKYYRNMEEAKCIPSKVSENMYILMAVVLVVIIGFLGAWIGNRFCLKGRNIEGSRIYSLTGERKPFLKNTGTLRSCDGLSGKEETHIGTAEEQHDKKMAKICTGYTQPMSPRVLDESGYQDSDQSTHELIKQTQNRIKMLDLKKKQEQKKLEQLMKLANKQGYRDEHTQAVNNDIDLSMEKTPHLDTPSLVRASTATCSTPNYPVECSDKLNGEKTLQKQRQGTGFAAEYSVMVSQESLRQNGPKNGEQNMENRKKSEDCNDDNCLSDYSININDTESQL